MAEKKKTTEKKSAAPKAAPAKPSGRSPKIAEVTERDLGPNFSRLVHRAAERLGVDPGDVVRAMVKKTGSQLLRTGPMGTAMALKRFL